MSLLLLPSANIVCKGYVFTPVCYSVHRGGVCLSACWDTPPLGRHLPWADTPRQTPLRQTPHPQADTTQADTPGRHLLGRHLPRQCMLGYTAPVQCMLGYTDTAPLSSAYWHTQCPVHAGIDMATAADGTHPTLMHSCCHKVCKKVN